MGQHAHLCVPQAAALPAGVAAPPAPPAARPTAPPRPLPPSPGAPPRGAPRRRSRCSPPPLAALAAPPSPPRAPAFLYAPVSRGSACPRARRPPPTRRSPRSHRGRRPPPRTPRPRAPRRARPPSGHAPRRRTSPRSRQRPTACSDSQAPPRAQANVARQICSNRTNLSHAAQRSPTHVPEDRHISCQSTEIPSAVISAHTRCAESQTLRAFGRCNALDHTGRPRVPVP